MKIAILSLILFLLCLNFSIYANPFGQKSREANPVEQGTEKVNLFRKQRTSLRLEEKTDFKFSEIIIARQLSLKRKITLLFKQVKHEKSPSLFLSLLGIAFLYGVIHSLGPGHNKFLISSYLLTEQRKISNGLFLGAAVSFLHGLSAIIIVLSIYYFSIGRVTVVFDQFSYKIKGISHLGIILIGGWLLFSRIYEHFFKSKRVITSSNLKNLKSFPVILAGGLIPCPGTMIILLFAIAHGAFKLGVILALTMTMGMVSTISLIALTVSFSKDCFLNKANQISSRVEIYYAILEIIGAGLVLTTGVVLFIGI